MIARPRHLLILVLALLLIAWFWWRRGSASKPPHHDEATTVETGKLPRLLITADRRELAPGESLELHAHTVPTDALSRGQLAWKASSGEITADGAEAVFVAAEPGSVWIVVALRIGDRTVTAFVAMLVDDGSAPTAGGNAPPRIISATVDKPVVCRRESTMLRVEAEDPDDLELKYNAMSFSPTLGRPVYLFGRWVRWTAPAMAGTFEILPFVEDEHGGIARTAVQVVVEDCDFDPDKFDPDTLRITATPLDVRRYQFDLETATQQVEAAGHKLSIVGWHFGDGETAAGAVKVTHDYPIVFDTRYTYFLIQAEIEIDGEPHLLEHGLTYYSYPAANLKAGYVALAVKVDVTDESESRARLTATFYNVTPYAAHGELVKISCLGPGAVPIKEDKRAMSIEVPGDGHAVKKFEVDLEDCPGGTKFELFGKAEGGYNVGGLWHYFTKTEQTGDMDEAERAAAREAAREQRHVDGDQLDYPPPLLPPVDLPGAERPDDDSPPPPFVPPPED